MKKANLEIFYNESITNLLFKELNFKNIMEVPKLEKIVLNMGLGDAKDNKNTLKQAVEELTTISGQRPVVTKSKKAISNFKIRQYDPVGVTVTLRKRNMYEFLERFIAIVSPRIRDFRGFSQRGFDGRGNYNFGINEQVVFPEIDYDKVNGIRGMNLTFVTSAKEDNSAHKLLKSFGFPFRELSEKIDEENA
jgi:large subunit ribosomal protein L5